MCVTVYSGKQKCACLQQAVNTPSCLLDEQSCRHCLCHACSLDPLHLEGMRWNALTNWLVMHVVLTTRNATVYFD